MGGEGARWLTARLRDLVGSAGEIHVMLDIVHMHADMYGRRPQLCRVKCVEWGQRFAALQQGRVNTTI